MSGSLVWIAMVTKPITITDALDRPLTLERAPTQVVSLVPSLTETVAALRKPGLLAAVTKFCLEPEEVVRPLRKIGGTKNPDIDAILALQPDLVLANKEENRREDIETLIKAGLPVYIGYPRSVEAALTEIETLAHLLRADLALDGITQPIREALAQLDARSAVAPIRVFCPVWRDPYLAVGGDTYADDVLQRCGAENVFAAHPSGGRYPQVTLKQIIAADPEVILLPSEPYRFHARHRDELRAALRATTAAQRNRIHLIDGRWLFWYGPRMAEALLGLSNLLHGIAATPQGAEAGADNAVKRRDFMPLLSHTPPPNPAKPDPSASTPTPPLRRAPAPPPAEGTALPPGLRLRVQSQDVVADDGPPQSPSQPSNGESPAD